MERKQNLWQKEKQDLDSLVKKLQEELQIAEKKAAKKATELANAENRKLLTEISQLRRKAEGDAEDWRRERDQYKTMIEQKQKEVEYRLDEQDRLKKDMATLKSRIEDQKTQLEDTRRQRDDVKEDLARHQQTWAKERSEITHKMRQDEKVQQAEHQALQLKFESRVKVMEDSSKRLQSQVSSHFELFLFVS